MLLFWAKFLYFASFGNGIVLGAIFRLSLCCVDRPEVRGLWRSEHSDVFPFYHDKDRELPRSSILIAGVTWFSLYKLYFFCGPGRHHNCLFECCCSRFPPVTLTRMSHVAAGCVEFHHGKYSSILSLENK